MEDTLTSQASGRSEEPRGTRGGDPQKGQWPVEARSQRSYRRGQVGEGGRRSPSFFWFRNDRCELRDAGRDPAPQQHERARPPQRSGTSPQRAHGGNRVPSWHAEATEEANAKEWRVDVRLARCGHSGEPGASTTNAGRCKVNTPRPREGSDRSPKAARAPILADSDFLGGGTGLAPNVRTKRDDSPKQGFGVREKTPTVQVEGSRPRCACKDRCMPRNWQRKQRAHALRRRERRDRQRCRETGMCVPIFFVQLNLPFRDQKFPLRSISLPILPQISKNNERGIRPNCKEKRKYNRID